MTIDAVSTVTPSYPNTIIEMPYLGTDSSAVAPLPSHTFKASITEAIYDEAGIGPEDLSLAEVYDLSTDLGQVEDRHAPLRPTSDHVTSRWADEMMTETTSTMAPLASARRCSPTGTVWSSRRETEVHDAE